MAPTLDPRPAADRGAGRGVCAQRSAAAGRAVRHLAAGERPGDHGGACEPEGSQLGGVGDCGGGEPAFGGFDWVDGGGVVLRGLSVRHGRTRSRSVRHVPTTAPQGRGLGDSVRAAHPDPLAPSFSLRGRLPPTGRPVGDPASSSLTFQPTFNARF